MYYATLKTKGGTYRIDSKTFLGGERTKVSESEYHHLLGNPFFNVETEAPKITEEIKKPEVTQDANSTPEPDETPEVSSAKPKKPSKKAQSAESK